MEIGGKSEKTEKRILSRERAWAISQISLCFLQSWFSAGTRRCMDVETMSKGFMFFNKNIKTEGSLQMFLVFSVLSLKMFLTCSLMFPNLDISWKIPHQSFKTKTISFSKPWYLFNVFLIFLALNPYVLIYFVLIIINVYNDLVTRNKQRNKIFLFMIIFIYPDTWPYINIFMFSSSVDSGRLIIFNFLSFNTTSNCLLRRSCHKELIYTETLPCK